MKISKLYVYPIKSLLGASVTEAEISKTGLKYDRKFMLLQVTDGSTTPPTLKNMHVTSYPQMTLFHTRIISKGDGAGDEVEVTYVPPGDTSLGTSITIPLEPDTDGLPELDVVMHSSPTKAYRMPSTYNTWFSTQFGFDVVLAYISTNTRPILGTFSPSANNTLSNQASSLFSRLSFLQPLGLGWSSEEPEGITFADCASFLVINDKSVDDASARLAGDETMDLTKFRPNIVVTGASAAWEEDFWGEIAISSSSLNDKHDSHEEGQRKGEAAQKVHIALTQNCVRCKSINIDYATGQPGTGEAGSMLKKLMKDRRVDSGAKWSPVFGRYGYLLHGLGTTIKVHDGVGIVKKLEERTVFGTLTREEMPHFTHILAYQTCRDSKH